MTDYINNPRFQELPSEEKYFSKSDGRIYIDLKDNRGYANEIEKLSRKDSKLTLKLELKNSLLRKMTLRAGTYLYVLRSSGLTLKYKTYAVVTQDTDLEK